jgi:predicted PhzF superfamily epimerase YddE/YHI9
MSASPDGITVHVVRVFCDDHGDHGNPLGVVIEATSIPDPTDRQEIASELGFSETVFIDDAATGRLAIYTPTEELPLAGHPLVGTSWLLRHLGQAIDTLRPPAGDVATTADATGAWIEANPELGPPWDLRQLPTIDAVNASDVSDFGPDDMLYLWTWIDEAAGLIRARCLGAGLGVEEDEATGSAALRLGAALGRPLEIHQGRGSVIHARPTSAGLVRVEGRVVLDEQVVIDARE